MTIGKCIQTHTHLQRDHQTWWSGSFLCSSSFLTGSQQAYFSYVFIILSFFSSVWSLLQVFSYLPVASIGHCAPWAFLHLIQCQEFSNGFSHGNQFQTNLPMPELQRFFFFFKGSAALVEVGLRSGPTTEHPVTPYQPLRHPMGAPRCSVWKPLLCFPHYMFCTVN